MTVLQSEFEPAKPGCWRPRTWPSSCESSTGLRLFGSAMTTLHEATPMAPALPPPMPGRLF